MSEMDDDYYAMFALKMIMGVAECKECPTYDDGACEALVERRDEYMKRYDTLDEAITAVGIDLRDAEGHTAAVLREVKTQIIAINLS